MRWAEAKTHSLRTTILVGLTAINILVIVGMTSLTHARAKSLAQEATEKDLELRARSLAGILEVEADGTLDFEETIPEYETLGSGSYAVMTDSAGKAALVSPSRCRHNPRFVRASTCSGI